ncbi:hypothetical protein [Candidatus Ichthyocystis hellenicum]|nr:hypothetical protein [Candidatus Ichthyocystis hellenicum]
MGVSKVKSAWERLSFSSESNSESSKVTKTDADEKMIHNQLAAVL